MPGASWPRDTANEAHMSSFDIERRNASAAGAFGRAISGLRPQKEGKHAPDLRWKSKWTSLDLMHAYRDAEGVYFLVPCAPGQTPDTNFKAESTYLSVVARSLLGALMCEEIDRQLELHGVAHLSRAQFYAHGMIGS